MVKIISTFFNDHTDSKKWAFFSTGSTISHFIGISTLTRETVHQPGLDKNYLRLYNTINSFSQLHSNWDSYNADPISETAIAQAFTILRHLQVIDILSSGIEINVFPMRDAGVQFEFDSEGLTSELEIDKEGKMKYIEYSENGEVLNEESFSDYRNIEDVLTISEYV